MVKSNEHYAGIMGQILGKTCEIVMTIGCIFANTIMVIDLFMLPCSNVQAHDTCM